MAKRRSLIVLIITIFLEITNGSNLDDVANELSAVSRLLNAVAMQNDFTEHPENTKKVIAEFLRIPDGQLLDELNALNLDGLSAELTAFQGSVNEMAPLKTSNMSRMSNNIAALNGMLGDSNLLAFGAVSDPGWTIKDNLDATPINGFETVLDGTSIESTYKMLDVLINRDKISLSDANIALKNGKDSFAVVVDLLNKIQNHELVFTKMLNAKDMSLDDVIKLGGLIEPFYRDKNAFVALHTQMDTLKDDLAGLSNFKQISQFHEAIGDLAKLNSLMGRMMNGNFSRGDFTVGFPGGSSDISLISKDLKESRILRAISNGKEWSAVEENLGRLRRFSEEMKALEGSWRKITENSELLTVFDGSAQILKSASTNFGQISKVDAVQNSMDDVTNCTANIKDPGTTVDFDGFNALVQEAANISKQVADIEEALKNVRALPSFDDGVAAMSTWKGYMENITMNSPDAEADPVFNAIFDSNVLITSIFVILNQTRDTILPFKTNNIFANIRKLRSWDIVTRVANSAANTGLYEAVSCLKTSNFDLSSLSGILSLRADLEAVKSVQMDALSKSVTSIGEVKKSIGKVKSTVGTTRHRRAGSGPFELKNYQQVSQNIGKGVASIRSLSEIVKAESNISTVLSLPAPIHNAAEQSSKEWSLATRDALKGLPPQLQKLEQFAGEQKGDDLEKIWSVFGEAEKVKGPKLDAKLLATPIADDLEQKPTTRSAGASFRSLSTLNLDFAQHEINLRSASLSLAPVQGFFDSYFGESQVEKEGVLMTDSMGIIILMVTVFVGVIIAYIVIRCVHRYIQERNNWKNRKRYWQYSSLRTIADQDLFMTIRTGNMQDLVELVKKKKYLLNRYQNGDTPLHHAVSWQQPEIVEYLIRHGAEREWLNDHGQTAEDMARQHSVYSDCGDTADLQKGLFDECVAIFDKLKGKTFKHSTPEQLPWQKYKVFSLSSGEHMSKFEQKYNSLYKGLEATPTHIVVDVDKNGVLDIDKTKKSSDGYYELWAVFSQAILVNHKWPQACVENKKNFYKDHEHRVTKVKYRGKVYESIDFWKKWVRGSEIPCLHRVAVFYDSTIRPKNRRMAETFMGVCPLFTAAVTTFIESVHGSEQRLPYWHPDKKMHFLIEPQDPKLKHAFYKTFDENTRRKCEVMTLEQFATWLLSFDSFEQLAKKRDKCVKENCSRIQNSRSKSRESRSFESAAQSAMSNESSVSYASSWLKSGSKTSRGSMSMSPVSKERDTDGYMRVGELSKVPPSLPNRKFSRSY